MRSTTRRRILAVVGASGTAAIAGCLGNDEDTTPNQDGEGNLEQLTTVGLETVVDGLEQPLDVEFFPDEEHDGCVATRPGEVLILDGGETLEEPLLDISERTVLGGERGLLGIEPHPDFTENGRLFVRYSSAPRDGTPDGYSHTFVVSEFEVSDGRKADPNSERTVLEIPQPQRNHNAGDLAFGPDGYLYVPTGDGGAGGDRGDGHVSDWYERNDGGNGQDVTENLLGSVLRIDVDETEDGKGYAVPDDNPLVGEEGMDEQYAWGFRNPWRISFDGGELYVADVGQNRYEEINLVEKGGNYGWNVREGAHCYAASDCPRSTPEDVRGGEPLVDPIMEYPHSGGAISGVSVIGGYVYRGSAVPELEGRYVFGDLQPQGRLFVGIPPDEQQQEGEWSLEYVDLTSDASGRLGRILSFGRDGDGEVYVLGSGGLHRIVPSG